jgi:hypothetical protein
MPRTYGTTNVMPYASAPAVGAVGDEYYNTTNKFLYLSDGTAWNAIMGGGGGGGGSPAWVGTITSPVAGTTYTLTHNLNTSTPFVQLWDAVTLVQVIGQVVAVNANQVQVTFSATPAHNVTVVVGGISAVGTATSTGPWTGTISTPAANTAYTLTHSLNTATPIVQMYDAVTRAQIMGQIVATTVNSITVTFTQAPPNNVTVVISTGGIAASGVAPSGPWTSAIVSPAALTTYTLTHSLNSSTPLVQLWDAVTKLQVQAQVTALDANRIAVLFATAPPNNVNVVVSSGGGTPGPTAANVYYLTYYQTIPAVQAGSPYTLNHRLNSTQIIVQLWDATTLQLVQAQVQIIDANNIRISVAQSMPNAVNAVVMIGPSTPAAVNPGDMASKSYVDTAGSTRYAFRGVRTAALNSSGTAATSQIVVFDQAPVNQGNCYNTTTGLYTCPVAGVYMVHGGLGWNLSASGQGFTQIFKNGAEVRRVGITSSGYAETSVTYIDLCVAGDTFQLNNQSSLTTQGIRLGTETYFNAVFMG